jgi:RHS repeat-associated protein
MSEIRKRDWIYRGARFYDSDIARFLSLDPLAVDFPEWSDYNYVLGNPLMFTDPDGRSPEPLSKITNTQAIYIINHVTTLFDKKLDEIWEKTDNGLTSKKEHSITFTEEKINFSGGEILGREKLEWTNEEVGEKGNVSPNYNVEEGKEVIGNAHTHPRKNIFSGGDVNHMRNLDNKAGNFAILERGGVRYAMVILDTQKAKKFFNDNDYNSIVAKREQEMHNARRIIDGRDENRKEKVTEMAMTELLEGTGIGLFKTIDENNTKYKRLD